MDIFYFKWLQDEENHRGDYRFLIAEKKRYTFVILLTINYLITSGREKGDRVSNEKIKKY